jgi:hypothetical protein
MLIQHRYGMVTTILRPGGGPAPVVLGELPELLLESERPVGHWVYDARQQTLFTTGPGPFANPEQYTYHGHWTCGDEP